MNAIELLKEQFKGAHDLMEGTVADVTDEMLAFKDTNKALPVSSAYVHAVAGEDLILTGMILQTKPICEDYQAAGLSEPMPTTMEGDKHNLWVASVKLDLPKFKAYAQKVYTQTAEYLATLQDEDLDQEVEIPGMGKHTLAFLISNFLLIHFANLTGEVSAAKGFQGNKGYPF
ncbi:hypothetical protein BH09PAT1_BH09PAT1_6810 [soil metagenome]